MNALEYIQAVEGSLGRRISDFEEEYVLEVFEEEQSLQVTVELLATAEVENY